MSVLFRYLSRCSRNKREHMFMCHTEEGKKLSRCSVRGCVHDKPYRTISGIKRHVSTLHPGIKVPAIRLPPTEEERLHRVSSNVDSKVLRSLVDPVMQWLEAPATTKTQFVERHRRIRSEESKVSARNSLGMYMHGNS